MEKDTFVVAIEDLVDVSEDDRCPEAEGEAVVVVACAAAIEPS
jgi:hypothetical protein